MKTARDPKRDQVVKIMRKIVDLARHARDVDMALPKVIEYLREFLAELEAIEASR